jgi:hypothetical protein
MPILGNVAASDEEVLTNRLTDGVFAQAFSALKPARLPTLRARSRSLMPPTGAARWMKPSVPYDS